MAHELDGHVPRQWCVHTSTYNFTALHSELWSQEGLADFTIFLFLQTTCVELPG